jgi:hypothetical protein
MNRIIVSITSVLLACIVFEPAGFAQGTGGQRLPQMPKEARHAILAEAGLARIDSCRHAVENGEEVFKVDITRNGIKRSFTVTPDGTLRSRQVFIGELTLPVQRAVAALQRVGQVHGIHWRDEDGDRAYGVEVARGEDTRLYTVGLDGTFQSTQVRLNETPEAVQKAIREQAGKGRVFHISRSELDAGQTYEALLRKSGKRCGISIGVDGSVLAVQVSPNELPPPVQKTITATAGPATITYAGRSNENGHITFTIITTDNAVRRELVISQNGDLIATVVPLAEAPAIVQKTLREKPGAGRVLRLRKLADGSGYEAVSFDGGRRAAVFVTPDGRMR